MSERETLRETIGRAIRNALYPNTSWDPPVTGTLWLVHADAVLVALEGWTIPQYDVNERPLWVDELDHIVVDVDQSLTSEDRWYFDPRPYVDAILNKLREGWTITNDEYEQVEADLALLNERAQTWRLEREMGPLSAPDPERNDAAELSDAEWREYCAEFDGEQQRRSWERTVALADAVDRLLAVFRRVTTVGGEPEALVRNVHTGATERFDSKADAEAFVERQEDGVYEVVDPTRCPTCRSTDPAVLIPGGFGNEGCTRIVADRFHAGVPTIYVQAPES